MIDRETLRTLIREVVTAEVAAAKGGAGLPRPAPAASPAVRIASDADLAAFARQVLSLAADPAARQAIEAGRHPFRLAPTAAPAGSASPSPARSAAGQQAAGGSTKIMNGVVSERTLDRLPRGTSTLHVGPEVAVTPLARDKARKLEITIERIRP